MSKKILFMSSAKLTAICFGLLLAVFCTIGMSFRPVYSEDEKELVMSGPRHAHWVSESSGCSGTSYTYNNKTDYGKAVAKTLGGGSVSVSNGSNSTSAYTNNSATTTGTQSYVTWNTNFGNSNQTGEKNDLAARHSNSITLTATPAAGYLFVGWYAEEACTTLLSSLEEYKPTVVIPGGVYEKGTIKKEEEAKNKYGNWQSSGSPYTETFYAKFKEITPVNLTFAACEGGTYTVTINSSSSTVSTSDVVKTGITTSVSLSATPAEGYVFTGWYQVDGNEVLSDLSSDASLSKSFSENITIGARFVSKQTGQFKIGSTTYYGLKAATIAAQANDVIIQVAEETVVDGSDLLPQENGEYIIPAGVKLLIPYESGNTWQTLPKVVTSAATLSAYKKLILMEGVNIIVNNGAQICIGGQAMAGSGSASDGATGYTTGACGVLDMSRGGHLELNDGSTLYCWGFVKGQDMDQGNNTVGVGTITVNSGATVWEPFSVGDWRGGSATSSIADTRFFPFQSYFMQNIEVPTTFWHGSSEWCYFTLNATGGPYDTKFAVIGSSNCLFKLTDAQSKVRTWYDPTTDLMCYELSGSAILDELKIKITGLPLIGTIDINSSQFDLPITSNMHLILADCTMNLTKPLIMQPGSVVEIKNDATVTLTNSIYLYDKDDWGPWVNGKYFKSRGNLTTHKNRGNGASNEFLDDAKFIIDGSFTIGSSGKLYSTAGGANIMGNDGGHLTYSSSLAGSVTSLRWYKSTTTSGDGETGTVAVNVANLCNEDESYTKAIASKTFLNIHGRWFNQTDGASAINADHTYNFTYIASGAVSGTGGTNVSPNTHNAVYAPDKTGLTAGMKWCNVMQDGTCSNIFNATQALNETPASDIRYTYPSSSWLQLLRTETEGVYGGSDNSLYAVDGCAVNSLGSVDENCLYTINDVKKALVDGHFVALEKNTEDEAWHDVANPTNYYICFEGCNWHPATKYAGEEKAYIVEEGDYIWYNNDWLLVEREDPFFLDYNEQNVKRYYEYEDGAWVLASPRVRVVDAIETRDFYKLPEAITVASGKKNTTITILKDISGINTRMTYTAKNTTCTLDLNGHTVSGAAPFGDDNNRGLLIINASGTTFTITDNSTNKEGRLENICNQNKVTYAVHLMGGTLNVEHGTIHAENPAQYAAKANATTGITAALTACGARGIQVNAAQKLNVTGGCIEAYATRNAYGIVAAGNAANTTLVTVSGGTIYAEAPYGAYGINCSGKLHVSGGTITGHLNTAWADGQYTQGSNSDRNCHQYAYGINMTASSNATASSCYYGTLTMTGGTVQATSAWDASYTCYAYGVRIQKALTAVADASKTADGTHSQKASATGSITGGTISVDIKGNHAYGVFVEGNYNSYNKTSNTFHISGATITSKAKNYAHGVYANASIDGTCGGYHYGIVEQDNNTVTAQTTAAYAYAVYVVSTSTTIFQDKQANYYGEYATAAEMTINSGTYTASAGSSTAYAAVSSTRSKSTYGSTTSVETNRTLGGNAEAYATLIINGGTFNATTKTTTARGVSSGGNTTIKDATFNVVAGTTTAYGLYALSGKLTATNVIVNDTAKGRTSSSNNNAYAYGVLVDCSIPNGNTAQTGFAYAGDVELNNCTINAVTTTYDNARALYVNATNKVYNWTQFKADSLKGNGSGTPWSTATYNAYKSVFPCTLQGRDSVSYAIAATATVNGGTFTAKAGRASAYGAVSTQTSVPANKEVTASPEMTLKNATFIAQTGTSTTAYGVQAGGPTLIEGCTITATAGNSTKYQSTASGVRALDKTTTIKNSTITATATDAAYGLEGYVEINATHGYCWHGEFDLSDAGTTAVTAEAKTSGKKAWSVYLQATNRNIASGNFAGDYATAANAIINGGTYKAIASGSGASAYCLSIAGKKTQGSVVAQPEVEVLDGFFNGATAEVGTAGVVGHTQLKGGYYVHNTNLATYAVAPKSVWTLPTTHEHYNPYKYKVAEHYTVTFKNGTTQLQQKDMEVGSIPAYTSTPTKDADAQYTYTFDGWSTTDGGDKLASLPAVSADATYFAHFTKTEQKYAVTVVSGGHGSVSPASVSGIGCETASGDITATPNVGYSFSGWTLPEGVTAAAGYTTSSNPIRIHATATGKTITANFTAKNYTVTLDNQSATTAGQASVTATYDAAMPSIAGNLPAKTGHDFGGYYSATNGGGTQYYNGTGASAHVWDIDAASPTLYAKWTPEVYTITYKDQGNVAFSGVHESGYPTKHTYGMATDLVDPSKEGYTFLGWYTSQDCSTGQVTSLGAEAYTADITLYAKWKQNKVTVTWDATTNGGTAAEPATTDVIPGDEVGALAATSKTGYTYQWYTASIGGTEVTTSTTVSENKTFYAQFTEITYEVTLAYMCNSTSIQADGSVYGAGIATAQNVTAPAITGYTFANWTLTDGVTSASTLTNATISINATADNKTITANYTKNSHTLTWNWDGGSTTSTAHTTGSVAYGTSIVYPEASTMTKENFVFNGWSIENATMPDENLTITAQWTPALVSVTAGGNTTYYTTLPAAFTAAKGKTNPTIKMLQDVALGASSVTYVGANTCILDLNGHTISGTSNLLFIVDNASANFTITDNSESKLGKLSMNTSSTTGAAFCAQLIKGKLYLEAGTIYLYTTSSSKNAVGVRVDDGEFIMNGGTVHTVATQNGIVAHGVQPLNSAKATINGGTVRAESANGVGSGMYVTGTITVNGGKFYVAGKTAYMVHASTIDATKVKLQGGYYNIDTNVANCIVSHYHKKTLSDTHPEYANGYRYTVDNLYKITWQNEDGSLIETTEVAYDALPTHEDPTKPSDAQYDYNFTGWSPNIVKVVGEATYTATFNDHTIRSYSVRWENKDGSEIRTDTKDYGTQPSYTGTPTYSDGTGKWYVFRSWKRQSTGVEYVSGDVFPYVGGPETYTAQYDVTNNLDVADEQTISITATVEVTTVRVEGKLTITSGNTLTTDDLILEGTPTSSGEIIGNVTAGKAYFDLSQPGGFKARTWYAIAVPWQVEVTAYGTKNGVYIKNGSADPVRQTMGTTFDLIYYDGAKRAAAGHSDACWKYVEYDAKDANGKHVMYPGRAYMIYLISDAQTIRFERMENTALHTNTLAVETYDLITGNSKDANWNGIANPATYHAYINANAKDYATETMNVGQVYNAETRTYLVVDMDANNLIVGQPIFVQATAPNSSVTAYAAHDEAFHAAPRRVQRQAKPLTRYDVMFAAVDEDVKERVIVRMDEDKEADEYIVGQDLAKMGVSSVVPQMWINRYDSRMCINTVAPVDNVADYPLGLFVPKNGEYDLFIADQPNSETMLYLTYDGEAIWNLSYGGYVLNLEKGTNAHYGLRIVYSAPKVATGIEEATIQNGDAIRKVLIEDKVFIIRNGEMYSVDGQMVK